MGECEGEGERTLDADLDPFETVHLSYLGRWKEQGMRGRPLTRDAVVKMIGDYPTQDQAGKDAINFLLCVDEYKGKSADEE